nr:hypothetical protein [Tanacetum cinerariifolium]
QHQHMQQVHRVGAITHGFQQATAAHVRFQRNAGYDDHRAGQAPIDDAQVWRKLLDRQQRTADGQQRQPQPFRDPATAVDYPDPDAKQEFINDIVGIETADQP